MDGIKVLSNIKVLYVEDEIITRSYVSSNNRFTHARYEWNRYEEKDKKS